MICFRNIAFYSTKEKTMITYFYRDLRKSTFQYPGNKAHKNCRFNGKIDEKKTLQLKFSLTITSSHITINKRINNDLSPTQEFLNTRNR